jgi:hypothetical protein
MAGSYATAPDRTCVRIARSATLRRRFAQKTKDTGFCYPCPPTLLLPISPAAHASQPSSAPQMQRGEVAVHPQLLLYMMINEPASRSRPKRMGLVC